MMPPRPSPVSPIIYPESDGQPLGENTLQVHWIVMLFNGFQGLFRDRSDVLVAADLFWYPVEGHPEIVTAPDVMIALGRPAGHRPSYRQWLENDTPPQVVIEVLSPGNRPAEMQNKLEFYDQYGVAEYYLYDPESDRLTIWHRSGASLHKVPQAHGWLSPRLGVRFDCPANAPMRILHPDGTAFLSYQELLAKTEAYAERANSAQKQATEARRKATQERRKALEEQRRADALARKLRELGIDPDSIAQ